ncbi:unnamed protein product [Linum tenue]|uniref:Uncharacterized protein n=1 Tax=Linum tenue TaxID=586396 RepID=A0AAV0JIP4_9ROSI|nr:unnamed protein product [Linum tenue]
MCMFLVENRSLTLISILISIMPLFGSDCLDSKALVFPLMCLESSRIMRGSSKNRWHSTGKDC